MDLANNTRNCGQTALGLGSPTAQYLNIGQWNSRSLMPKKQEFDVLLNQEKISICLLSETWLCSETKLRINGYNIYRKDRCDDYGGVAIVVHHSIKTQLCSINVRNTGIEIICVKIMNCKYLKYIASVYCPRLFRPLSVIGMRFSYNLKKKQFWPGILMGTTLTGPTKRTLEVFSYLTLAWSIIL